MSIMTPASKPDISIRSFRPGDEASLRQIFVSSIHGIASRHYTGEQISAWAPLDHDPATWASRMATLQPFVAEFRDRAVGYADLQDSGYIDHFFVAADAAGQGVGAALMQRIHEAAADQRLQQLWANVSRSAEGFFARYGFIVQERQAVTIRGVILHNARMDKSLRP